jgi:hypothetical protein
MDPKLCPNTNTHTYTYTYTHTHTNTHINTNTNTHTHTHLMDPKLCPTMLILGILCRSRMEITLSEKRAGLCMVKFRDLILIAPTSISTTARPV